MPSLWKFICGGQSVNETLSIMFTSQLIQKQSKCGYKWQLRGINISCVQKTNVAKLQIFSTTLQTTYSQRHTCQAQLRNADDLTLSRERDGGNACWTYLSQLRMKVWTTIILITSQGYITFICIYPFSLHIEFRT